MLPHDSKARRLFVTSGGLKKIQEMEAEPGSALQEYIMVINNCYPEEIVRWAPVPLGPPHLPPWSGLSRDMGTSDAPV